MDKTRNHGLINYLRILVNQNGAMLGQMALVCDALPDKLEIHFVCGLDSNSEICILEIDFWS